MVSLLVALLFDVGPALADANAELNKGAILIAHLQYRDAIKTFDRVINLDPRLDYAYALRGQAHLALEHMNQAKKDLDQAIAMDSKKWLYFELRSRYYFETGNLDAAIADVTSAIRLSPRGSSLYRMRSNFYAIQKKPERALADLNKAIEYQKDNADASFKSRGDLYYGMKKFDLAVRDYTSALNAIARQKSDDKQIESCYSARAKAYDKLGKTALAAADRKKVQSFVKDGWGAFLYDEHK